MVFEATKWGFVEAMKYNERGHKGAGEWLLNESELSLKDMKELERFVRQKANSLYDKLTEAGRYLGSDDGYSDLLYQIVANGEDFYNNITVERAKQMIDNEEYKESFSYAFLDIPE